MFTEQETAYLQSQRLARLATVASSGQPTVDAVGFQFDGRQFFIGGRDLARTRKYRNIAAGHDLVALIIDDLAAVEPWTPRGIKIHGTAEIVQRAGVFGPGEYFVVTPRVTWSWGLLGSAFAGAHKIAWPDERGDP